MPPPPLALKLVPVMVNDPMTGGTYAATESVPEILNVLVFQTTTNRDGKVAESVFIAGLFVHASHELAAIASRHGHSDDATCFLTAADRMEQTIKKHGWDGDWFLRAYDSFGEKIGSKEREEGKIFIESNGFCVLAGIGLDDGRGGRTGKR